MTPLEWGILAGCLLLAALLTGSETAFLVLNRLQIRRLQSARDARSRRTARLLERPDRLVPALRIGILAFEIAFIALGTAALVRAFGAHGLRIAVPAAIAAVLLLVEAGPRVLGAGFPEAVARAVSGPVAALVAVLGRPAAAANGLARRAVGPAEGGMERGGFLAAASEIHALYEGVGEAREMSPEERRLAENIFEFSQTTAEQIMTPRVDIIAAPADALPEDLRRTIVRSRHTRIPVFEGTLDNITGFVNSKEFLLNAGRPMAASVKPVAVFPETARIEQIFHDMQKTKARMVIVVNEFGETVGLITNEDLVEEVVGEIYDEFERDQVPVLQVGPGEYVADGRISVDALNEELGLALSEESSVTLNGLIQELLGQIPRRGSIVEHEGVRFEVLEMDGHRVRRCRITRTAPRAAEEGPPA
jgi:CBS domain containing-hemolysin-like protein